MLATFQAPGLADLAARMASLGGELAASLSAASETIRVDAMWTVESLYPPGTAYAWQSAINTIPEAVASVEIKTDDPILYWYEYGTKPHEIQAHEGSALAFAGTNEYAGMFILADHVEHPGESAHPNAGIVMAAMGEVARTEWGAAVQELLIATLTT